MGPLENLKSRTQHPSDVLKKLKTLPNKALDKLFSCKSTFIRVLTKRRQNLENKTSNALTKLKEINVVECGLIKLKIVVIQTLDLVSFKTVTFRFKIFDKQIKQKRGNRMITFLLEEPVFHEWNYGNFLQRKLILSSKRISDQTLSLSLSPLNSFLEESRNLACFYYILLGY